MGAWVFFYLLPHLCLGWRCVRLVFLYLELWWSLMTSDNNRSIGNPKYRPTSFFVVLRNKPFDSKHLFLSLSLRVPNSALGVKSDSPIFWNTPFDYEDLFLVTCLCISLSRRKREMQQKITILVLRQKKKIDSPVNNTNELSAFQVTLTILKYSILKYSKYPYYT